MGPEGDYHRESVTEGRAGGRLKVLEKGRSQEKSFPFFSWSRLRGLQKHTSVDVRTSCTNIIEKAEGIGN